MASLASELFETPLVCPQQQKLSVWRHARMMALPVPRAASDWTLYIARSPSYLKRYLALPEFTRPGRRAIWIIDSFRTEIMPHSALFRHFDLVAYTQKGEAPAYNAVAPGRTVFLGWGTDALRLGTSEGARDIDVLRVGRQPETWTDDSRSAITCAASGLHFHGRPPADESATPTAAQRHLMRWYGRAKFLIAFSNLAAPASYTHPTKDYITGRWTDALAAGAVVAGISPFQDASREDLLWPGATLEFHGIDLTSNTEVLRKAVEVWSPDIARHNHKMALEKLDWRWRFQTLARRMNITAPMLKAEITQLENMLSTAG
ncbi:hypothetical protein [Jannaschia sp. CCS1]|uniref:hypothetical protein n=1 Tax=Jannaschia sp. (strain CCS1) TaxID=290400 RepID=UPI0006836893|nr:hypothetical protein [Jannaschia sp. CCS1]